MYAFGQKSAALHIPSVDDELQHGSLVSAEVPFLRKLPVNTLKDLAAKLKVKDAQSMNKKADLVKKLSSVKDDILNQFLPLLNQEDSRLQKFELLYRNMVRDNEVSGEEPIDQIDSKKLLNEDTKFAEKRNILMLLSDALGVPVVNKNTKTKTIINNIKNVGVDSAQLNITIKRVLSKKEQDEKERGESKKCIWSGGNWVTILVNLPDQIEYLGPFGLIW